MKRETSFTNLCGVVRQNFHTLKRKSKNISVLWRNLKKRDKLRMIGKYELSLDCNFIEKKSAKGAITSDLLLRFLKSGNIAYKNYEIETISGDYFNKKS